MARAWLRGVLGGVIGGIEGCPSDSSDFAVLEYANFEIRDVNCLEDAGARSEASAPTASRLRLGILVFKLEI
jgi:hypothetical protein